MVMKVIKNLRKLRCEKGISQQNLGETLLVSQQSINKYENHDVEPDIEMLIKIADYFNVSLDYLVGRTDIKEMIDKMRMSDLSDEEVELVSNFRNLSEGQKKAVIGIVESY